MDNSLIEILLLFLLGAVALNLVLTMRIASIVREAPEPQDLPFTLPLDAPLPAFAGKRLQDGGAISLESLAGRSSVLVFLSAGCGDCRKKVPELVGMLPAMQETGVELLIVGMDSEAKVRAFLGATPLFSRVVVLDKAARRRLNPRNASPFYIFVDDRGLAQASHFIGDENWQVFATQMHELNQEVEGMTVHEA